MQMNGGYFGSMMPQGATSFMPQGPSAQSMIGGIAGTPQAFTSPPVGNDFLAFLKRMSGGMQGMGDQQSGGPSALPANSFSPFMPNAGQPQGQPGQQPGPMDAIQKAMAAGGGGQAAAGAGGAPFGSLDPSMLQGILQRLGMAGSTGAIASI